MKVEFVDKDREAETTARRENIFSSGPSLPNDADSPDEQLCKRPKCWRYSVLRLRSRPVLPIGRRTVWWAGRVRRLSGVPMSPMTTS